MSTLGINVGSVVAILVAAFGLSSLVTSYPGLTQLIEIAGGLYVIYLAALIWPGKTAASLEEPRLQASGYHSLFKNGVITSFLNPKDILFYTAFIPTFIPDTVTGNAYLGNFLSLAFAYMAIGFITKIVFSVFAGFTKKVLRSKSAGVVNYLSSTMLFALGAYLLGKSVNLFSG